MSTRKPPGPRRDCHCPKARHEHGTLGAYQRDSCRCDECRAANAARWYTYTTAGPLVDAAPVRERIALLLAEGAQSADITRRTGISGRTIARIRDDVTPRVTTPTAAAILALRPRCTRRGARRRIQALHAVGWRLNDISACAHVSPYMVQSILRDDPDRMRPRAATLARVYALYDRAVRRNLTPPGGRSQRAIRRAAQLGWVSPMRWADIDHDEQPEPVLRRRGADALAEDLAHGMTVHDIARARHVSTESAASAIYRATGRWPSRDQRKEAA
ncbi:hypothetical protein [Propionibacterium australiense]|uniref:Uncharacterized protein n=1 Tax=Propionibacterium australiense TaxID=119981 RepID=A0A8B3FNQ4_9ACTN|nr:hypothetical protein [Propionibacterium australiense]RLP12243.1 hypothetical protein D7U36_03005 [Propionibacterium australiense]